MIKKIIVSQSQTESEVMLEKIVTKKVLAEKQRHIVEADSKRIKLEEERCKEIANEAEIDLAIALPALEDAQKKVERLDKSSISELKAYVQPPEKVERTLSCVMVLLGKETDWFSAKKCLGESTFLTNLKFLDKDSLCKTAIAKVGKFVSSCSTNEVSNVSKAAGVLCSWCHAIYLYANVLNIITPKRSRLKTSLKEVAQKQYSLSTAEKNLDSVVSKVDKLKEQYEENIKTKNYLKTEARDLEKKLTHAKELIDGLGGEFSRWTLSINNLAKKKVCNLIGDSLVTSAFLTYAGPFNVTYRDVLIKQWVKAVESKNLYNSHDFTIINFLSDDAVVKKWNLQGLPKDDFSTENGVIVTHSNRWPLMVDPENQAKNWIKALEGDKLKSLDVNSNHFLTNLENCITTGASIALEGINKQLNSSLDSIINKDLYKVGNNKFVKLGEKEVEYNDSFRVRNIFHQISSFIL